ncbi:hypothetical protein YH64_029975, partial [Achromobacter sp. LC458]|uniref:hypothetical protein n=1 Tax=Achromobacter sp. LC458 TaxID=1120623 RepID=UPI001170F3F2
MYLIEWLTWLGNIKSDAWINAHTDTPYEAPPIYEDPTRSEQQRVHAQRFAKAKIRSPVYACDDTILEMRCGAMEEKRGFITLISAFFSLPTIAGIDLMCLSFSLSTWETWDFDDTILLIILLIGSLGAPYIYFKYLFRFTRLESF